MTKPNFNRSVVAAALAAGLLLGLGGLAAASAQSEPGTSQTETNDLDNEDSQDPSYVASITYTEVDGQSEADEAADLAGLATISDGNGGHTDVKVDAGNGNVVHQDTDDNDDD